MRISFSGKSISKLIKISRISCTLRCSSTFQKFYPQDDGSLYENHRSLSNVQKLFLAFGSAFASLNNPHRGDMIAALGETTGYNTLRELQLKMLNDETGLRILSEKPIINGETVNVHELIKYKKESFGYHFAKYMFDNKISLDTRSKVHYVDDAELAYIMNRYRQIHDFIHCLLGFSVSVSGEIVVKWFEMAHFGFPMNTLSAFFGPLAVTNIEEHRQIRKLIPWALYNGTHMKCLLNVYFEEHLDRDFEDFKKELGLTQLPYPCF